LVKIAIVNFARDLTASKPSEEFQSNSSMPGFFHGKATPSIIQSGLAGDHHTIAWLIFSIIDILVR